MKPSHPKAWREIEVPLYGGVVIIYRTRSALRRAYDGFRIEAAVGPEDGSCVLADTVAPRAYLIGWYDGKASTLIHEVTHAAIFAFTLAGIDPRDSQGEAFAYLLGSLTSEIL